MAKVSGPLFGLDARGQVGKAIVYSFWRGVNYVRQYVVPKNAHTDEQIAVRNFLTDASVAWKNEVTISPTAIDAAYKLAYKKAAAGMAESGFNMFIKDASLKNDVLGGYIAPLVLPTVPGDITP